MFDRLEIRVLSARPLADTQLRFWVNGEDLIDAAFGEGGRGPYAADALSAGSLSSFQATGDARRLELREPHCTGGSCGFLAVVVQRVGEIVQWSDWEIPWGRAHSRFSCRPSSASMRAGTTPKWLALRLPAGSRNILRPPAAAHARPGRQPDPGTSQTDR
ncbi:hypothetical protein ACFYXX_34745 [Streptomyces sp. NPDC002458]|uniref:hypothetical protein n=1 Tax=Streptomyces sp. NPDC002458 TaxID=3364644 RepID=UPI003674D90B